MSPPPRSPAGLRASGASTGWTLVALAGLSGALAVAAGAFGAHALQDAVTPERLATFRTGAQYHLAHAVALALAGFVAAWRPEVRGAVLAGWLFLAGTVLFSGSLYVLVLLDLGVLGLITPFGGVAFISGWLALAWGAWTQREGLRPSA